MEWKTHISLLVLALITGCSAQPLHYDKLSYDEFSSLLFQNENYLAMQQPCKAYNLRQHNKQALSCYQSVARSHPDSPEAQYLLAMAYLHAGDPIRTKQQVLIIEKQSHDFLRLAFHAIAKSNKKFIKSFEFEPRWLTKS